MKSKAIFFVEKDIQHIFRAFDSKTRTRLTEALEFPPEIICLENMGKYQDFLSETQYIFSTWGMPCLNEDEIRRYFPKLTDIFYAAGSVQDFARPFLHSRVEIHSAWAANAVPVAEFTTAQIVLAGKGYHQGVRRQLEKGRQGFLDYNASFPGNYDIKVGILGAGMIGSMVMERLKNFQVEVLAYDPFVSDEKLHSLHAHRAELDEIFSQCQTISNHIADLPETKNMLTYRYFSKMRKNATFINTGRGAQVCEADLIRALKEEPDRTALLDVTDPEPPDSDSPLLYLPNVILTPHIAGSQNQEIARMGLYMAEEFEAVISGKTSRYSVSLEMLQHMA